MGLAARIRGDAATGGTPRYLPPEVRRGEPATPAADLYALGIVLAEILDATIAAADDPALAVSRAAATGTLRAPFDGWVAALLADAPGARPSAEWLASRAAHELGLTADEAEVVAARRARVRRAYLAVRADDIATSASISPAIAGEPRRWLEESLATAVS